MKTLVWLTSILMICGSSPKALAENLFYHGKTVTIVTSMGGGGSNDLIARMLARYMPSYIPGNPSMVVQNMPGGGNVVATNYMYNVAPKDGTEIADVDNAIPLNQMLQSTGIRYDASKFDWLGSPLATPTSIVILASTGIKTMEDLRKIAVIMGGIGAGSSNAIWPTVIKNVLGVKFKVVLGYQSGPELWFAMDRGEIQGRTGSYSDLIAQRPQWIRDKKIVFIAQLGSTRDKNLPDVPMISELAGTNKQRQILDFIFSPISLGEPYLAPPGTDPRRLALLRTAFQATIHDPRFVADVKKIGFDINPISAKDISDDVTKTVRTPIDVIARAKAAMR